MKTWLFIWNPARWAWDDSLTGYAELYKELRQTGYVFGKWSCGGNKSIRTGDRIFLIRLGGAERGIVASGFAATDVFEGTHWDADSARQGKPARRVYVRWDKILDIAGGAVLPYENLRELDPAYHWSPMSSGVSIPEETAEKLERLWETYK